MVDGDNLASLVLLIIICLFVIYFANEPDYENRAVCDSGFESSWGIHSSVTPEGTVRYGKKIRKMVAGEQCWIERREV